MSEASAYHEAGHAFAAVLVGARVRSMTIEPDRDHGPARHAEIEIEWPLDQFSAQELQEKAVLVALAGPAAEMTYSGDPYHPGFIAEWSADWKEAWSAAERLCVAERARLSLLEQRSRRLLRLFSREGPWAAVAALADNLLAHTTLEGEEVEDIVRQWF